MSRIQLRRDTAANWGAANPVLASGEIGVESDTGKLKLGDGVTAWGSLPYRMESSVTKVSSLTPDGSGNVDLSGIYVPTAGRPKNDLTAFGVYLPEAHGAQGDGVTDDTAAVNAAISAAQANGGTVYLNNKTYLCLGAIAPTYSGPSTAPVQKPVRITSAGAATANGYWAASPLNGGAILDLRYTGADTLHPAKIDTRGAGWLEIDHVTLLSGGTDNYPFFQTTNTTVAIHHCAFVGNQANSGTACQQDAILFGGSSSVTVGNAAGAPFQGYGSRVHDNYFHHIRRGFVGRVYCNSVPVENNTFSTSCGNSTGGAIEFHGDDGTLGGQQAVGNSTRGNTIEVANYKYGIAAYYAYNCNFGPDGFYDPTATYAGAVYVDTTSSFNEVIDGYRHDQYPLVVDAGATTTIHTAHQSQPTIYPQPVRFTFSGGPSVINADGSGEWAFDHKGNRATVVTDPSAYPFPGVQLVTVPAQQATDVVTTSGSPVITSATANWNAEHAGMPIAGPGIPAGALILSYQSATQVTMTANATATATGVSVTWGDQINGTQTTQVEFIRQHMYSQGGTPSAAVAAGSGTGATVSVTGTDMSHTVTLTTGTAPAAGTQVTVGFAVGWGQTARVLLMPKNAASAAAAGSIYVAPSSGGNYTIGAGTALAASTVYEWDAFCVA